MRRNKRRGLLLLFLCQNEILSSARMGFPAFLPASGNRSCFSFPFEKKDPGYQATNAKKRTGEKGRPLSPVRFLFFYKMFQNTCFLLQNGVKFNKSNLWRKTSGGKPLEENLWRKTSGGKPLEENLWRKTSGGKPLEENLWRKTSGGKPLEENLWRKTSGGKPLEENLWRKTSGGKPLEENLWRKTSGGKPLEENLWRKTSGGKPLEENLWRKTSGNDGLLFRRNEYCAGIPPKQ